jgi:hypothetical protein
MTVSFTDQLATLFTLPQDKWNISSENQTPLITFSNAHTRDSHLLLFGNKVVPAEYRINVENRTLLCKRAAALIYRSGIRTGEGIPAAPPLCGP